MKNIAIINGISLSDWCFKKTGDVSPFERVVQYARELPGVEKVVLLASGQVDSPFESVVRESWDGRILLETMGKCSGGYENIFYFYGDAPFLDGPLSGKMLENHKKYFAEYTFADGYPAGLAPEILKSSIINRLLGLLKEESSPVERNTLFEIIKKDINAFDIETEIAPVDQRLLRAALFADTKRNFQLIERLSEKGPSNLEELTGILEDAPQIIRTLPAYYSIQITTGCPQVCSYCAYSLFEENILGGAGQMSYEDFDGIIGKIEAFSEDGVIGLSPWGEPAAHKEIGRFINRVISNTKLTLVIETSGIGWDHSLFEELKDSPNAPIWIVSLDSNTPGVYEKLRGRGFEEARECARRLLSLFPGKCWIQGVRMKENEEDLELFYDMWKKETENIIIQKYDDFCGRLPDRKVTDLSPVNRFPCRHLCRDMTILIDGTIPLCREDIKKEFSFGNIFTGELGDLWEKGGAVYGEHGQKKYNKLCESCDEYYTYNF